MRNATKLPILTLLDNYSIAVSALLVLHLNNSFGDFMTI